jgi:hypothetical protein
MRALLAGSVLLALTLSAFTPAGVAQAAPTPSAPITSGTVTKTVRVDVDGDGKNDLVQLIHLDANNFRLQVTTAKNTSALDFVSVLPADGEWDGNLIWYGAASLDGTRGAELIVSTFDADSWENGDTPTRLGVFTWRSGRLMPATAPKAPKNPGWHLGTTDANRINGYRFFTKTGRHYVDVADLTDRSNRWRGKIVRSIWKKGVWVKVSTRSVKLGEKAAGRYETISGPAILLGQASVDIDGDGRNDTATYRRLVDSTVAGAGTWTLTVKTGKDVRKVIKVAADSDPLMGFAGLDGVSGSEIIFTVDHETPLWKVFTWRKGKLALEAGPNECGDSSKVWQGCGDGYSIGLDFSVVDAQHYLLVSSHTTDEPTLEASFAKYVWRAGKWVKQSAWSAVLSEADFAKLCSGFCGAQMIGY